MAIISSTTVLVYIPVACLFLANCKNEPLKVVPTVSTSPPTNITANSALVSSNISSDGGSKVSSRGVCWSTSANPTTVNSKITDGTGTGVFTSSISGLSPDMRYHVRAYATNSMGTSYGDDITFTTNGPNTDADGNTYSTVTIGTQVWMASNLKTTKYKDGTAIPLVIDNVDWSNISTPGYCWYNNNEAAIKNTYGALYNWYAVNTGKLCPTGWHVPTDHEWRTLGSFLGGESIAGGKLKETGTSHWMSPNTGATNEVGFTALPGGRRGGGAFSLIGAHGYWWSSTESSSTFAWSRYIYYDHSFAYIVNTSKQYWFSVRCLRDN